MSQPSGTTPQLVVDVETLTQALAAADRADVWTTMPYQKQARFLLDTLAAIGAAATYQPGDIVRDAEGNIWVRATGTHGWALVYIFNGLTDTNAAADEHDNLYVPVPPMPLTLLSRGGKSVATEAGDLT